MCFLFSCLFFKLKKQKQNKNLATKDELKRNWKSVMVAEWRWQSCGECDESETPLLLWDQILGGGGKISIWLTRNGKESPSTSNQILMERWSLILALPLQSAGYLIKGDVLVCIDHWLQQPLSYTRPSESILYFSSCFQARIDLPLLGQVFPDRKWLRRLLSFLVRSWEGAEAALVPGNKREKQHGALSMRYLVGEGGVPNCLLTFNMLLALQCKRDVQIKTSDNG